MHQIETMSWTRFSQARILPLAGTRFLLRIPMFPNCANPECSASFGKLRDGHLFRFRRTHVAGDGPSNSHSVEHAWLCAKCSEIFTLEYRNNCSVLVALPLPAPVSQKIAQEEIHAPMPTRGRRRIKRRIRRPRSRRGLPSNVGNAPVVLLAITPKGDFPERS